MPRDPFRCSSVVFRVPRLVAVGPLLLLGFVCLLCLSSAFSVLPGTIKGARSSALTLTPFGVGLCFTLVTTLGG